MVIFINDEEKDIAAGAVISDLFKELKFESTKGLAVAVNNQIVLQKNWITTKLKENDKLLVISATKGG